MEGMGETFHKFFDLQITGLFVSVIFRCFLWSGCLLVMLVFVFDCLSLRAREIHPLFVEKSGDYLE